MPHTSGRWGGEGEGEVVNLFTLHSLQAGIALMVWAGFIIIMSHPYPLVTKILLYALNSGDRENDSWHLLSTLPLIDLKIFPSFSLGETVTQRRLIPLKNSLSILFFNKKPKGILAFPKETP